MSNIKSKIMSFIHLHHPSLKVSYDEVINQSSQNTNVFLGLLNSNEFPSIDPEILMTSLINSIQGEEGIERISIGFVHPSDDRGVVSFRFQE